jgi:hypothetical protein
MVRNMKGKSNELFEVNVIKNIFMLNISRAGARVIGADPASRSRSSSIKVMGLLGAPAPQHRETLSGVQ